jgi:hypothetical protein
MNILRNVSLIALQVSGFSLHYTCRASSHVLQECSMHENAYVSAHINLSSSFEQSIYLFAHVCLVSHRNCTALVRDHTAEKWEMRLCKS